ncbi:MAG: hypothetical protein ACLTE4_00995 [Christensenellaceae bacterium]
MKKKNKVKILTFLVAGAIGTAALGGGLMLGGIKAGAVTYEPSRIFTAEKSASVGTDSDDDTLMAFTLPDSGSVSFKRDLALKWYDGKDAAKYLTMKFALKDTNFEKLTLTFEAAPSMAMKEKKATNTVVFEKANGKVTVKVNDGQATELSDEALKADIELSLAETDEENTAGEGEFFVLLNESYIGTFTNVGANFAEYSSTASSTPMVPFAFTAEMPEGAEGDSATTKILFKELNGQSFELDEDKKIADTAKPVLVVNDSISSFALGTPFSLDYEVIDVLDTSVTKMMEYYQYNPDDFSEDSTKEPEYETLTTSTYFMDTPVYKEKGMEYISVRFKLNDDTFSGDDNAATYELVWYAEETEKPTEDSKIEYIRADRNTEGPDYTCIVRDNEGNHELDGDGNSVLDEANQAYLGYQEAVEEAAKDVYAGTNSYVYLPSPIGLITDNDTGYKNLKYNIYYKTQTSDSPASSTGISYEDLKLAVGSTGLYEFKITASDKAGNEMYCYVDGYRTKVTSDNVWDIEAIPSFTFSISNCGISVEEPDGSDNTDSGFIDVTYTLSDFTVVGIDGHSSEYGLYYFDTAAFRKQYPDTDFSDSDFSLIKFSELKENADLSKVEDDDYLNYYAGLYAELLSKRLGLNITADDLMKPNSDGEVILREIEPYDDTIDEDKHPDVWKESDNKYYWYPSSKSFKPQEQGVYIVLAVFTDAELSGEKAAAYQAVSVNAKEDTIKGETQWLKNNIVSVVLFSIAAVMLILIIILLVVKPSDETLEDVENGKKKKKKSKKDKKSELEKLDEDEKK